jgi:hypothetical protein
MGRGQGSYKRKVTSPRVEIGSEAIDLYSSQIKEVLFRRGESLLKSEYKEKNLGRPARPYEGHCYTATEALFHLLGGYEQEEYRPYRLRHEGATHWWLRSKSGQNRDLTNEQFLTPVPYEQGVGNGFLTRQPSKRAQIIIDDVKTMSASQ